MDLAGNGFQICRYLWCVFAALWLLRAIRTKPVQTRESRRSRMLYVTFTVAGCYATFSSHAPLGWMEQRLLPAETWVAALGILVTAAGLAFAVWARFYLGGNWSSSVTVKVGHQLVRTGPYRWVRHPIYSGMLLGMFGTAIALGQVRGFVGTVLLWVGFTLKSKIEERYMAETFGQEYEEYTSGTGALLPHFHAW